MEILPSMKEVLTTGRVDAQALRIDVAKGSEDEIEMLPWQMDEDGQTSLLGIVNGILEKTTGMVLVAVSDDARSGSFQWWCLREVWWARADQQSRKDGQACQ